MRNKIFLMITAVIFGTAFGACKASFSTGNGAETSSKPANTTAEKKDSNSNSAKKEEKPKTEVKDSERPKGEAKTAKKENQIPEDWTYYYNESKGFGFYVPKGTEDEQTAQNGLEVTGMTTPTGIDIYVLAYKDKTLTKENLLNDAADFLEANGHKKVTPGALKAESEGYAVADATSDMEDGRKAQMRILVGTDVTDNYIMILGTELKDFAANEKIIDEIWGSFEMWSGAH